MREKGELVIGSCYQVYIIVPFFAYHSDTSIALIVMFVVHDNHACISLMTIIIIAFIMTLFLYSSIK